MTQQGDRSLVRDLERLARERGLHGLGIADLTVAAVHDEIRRQGGEGPAALPRAVSLVHRLQDALVDPLLEEHRSPVAARMYDFHVYRAVNPHLDDVALMAAGVLQEAGYRAMPVPTSVRVDEDNYAGLVSHKLPAHQGGLGWIGRSCLLITPEAGPRVRLATVLTDAPLPVDPPNTGSCGSCRECVDACPAGAFTGRAFESEEPLAARMDVRACDAYRLEASEVTGVTICGMCVSVCPYGRSGDSDRSSVSVGAGTPPDRAAWD